jgi:hypothetical protein
MGAWLTLRPSRTVAAGGAALAMGWAMRCIELCTGRWRVELGGGMGIEIILLFSKTIAFWSWSGGLFAEIPVGDG